MRKIVNNYIESVVYYDKNPNNRLIGLSCRKTSYLFNNISKNKDKIVVNYKKWSKKPLLYYSLQFIILKDSENYNSDTLAWFRKSHIFLEQNQNTGDYLLGRFKNLGLD